MQPRTAFVSVSLVAADFVRPQAFTTEQFGQQWEQRPAERKQRFSPVAAIKSPEQFVTLAAQHLHVACVQV